MKYIILLVVIVLLILKIKNIENFSLDKEILEKEFPYLIKDNSEPYFTQFKCIDYEDIRI